MRKAALIVMFWGALPVVSCSFRQEMPVQRDTRVTAGEMKGTWKGGVVNKSSHTVRGADLLQISFRGSHEAAAFAHAVEYRSGKVLYRAEILFRGRPEECMLLQEQVLEEGVLVRAWRREICAGETYGAGPGE